MNDIANDGAMKPIRDKVAKSGKARRPKASSRHAHLRQLITTELKLKAKLSEAMKNVRSIHGALREVRKQLREF